MGAQLKQNGQLHALLADHASLRQALEKVSETISRRQQPPAVVAEMIDEAVDRVLAHFRHEERGGHLSLAMDAAPHLGVRADGLLQEHAELARTLADIQWHVRTAPGSSAWWDQLHEMYQRFLRAFLAHEAAENRLLQAAYNEDIGAED
jgi:hypothetical protein